MNVDHCSQLDLRACTQYLLSEYELLSYVMLKEIVNRFVSKLMLNESNISWMLALLAK